MKLLFLICTCLFFAMHADAQWTRQHPFPKLAPIRDIQIAKDGFGFAVGDNTVIFKTMDAGAQWDYVIAPNNGWNLSSVQVLEGSGGMVVFAGGTGLLKSSDGGNTWSELSGAPTDIIEMKLVNEETVLICTTIGVYKSTDGGISWTDLGLPVVSIQDAHILDEMHIWASTLLPDEIWRTLDGGTTWTKNTSIVRHDHVQFFDALNGLVIDNRDVYRTNNGGETWTLISDNGLQSNLFSIDFGDDMMHIYTALNGGRTNYSTDGGVTWNQVTTSGIPTSLFTCVEAIDNNSVLLGGKYSTILRSNDQLANMSELTGGSRWPINGVDFLDRNQGLAAGINGTLLTTEDGGNHWIEIPGTSRNYLCLDFFDEENAWAGSNQRILHSSDKGFTWSESLILTTSNVQAIRALDEMTVMAVNTSGIIFRTQDQGVTWDTVYNDNNGTLQDIEITEGQIAYACGFNGRILKSTNMGITWSLLQVPEVDQQYEDIHFLTNNEGWVVSSNFINRLWHTADGGLSWDTLNLPSLEAWTGVHFINQDTGVVVGRGNDKGVVYITFDGGKTWPSAQITEFPYNGISGTTGRNAGVWIHGVGGNIEVLLTCDAIPTISNLVLETVTPCPGDTVTCTVDGTNIETYHWTFPAGWFPIGNTNAAEVEVIAMDGSFGFITIFGSNVCANTSVLERGAGVSFTPEVMTTVTEDFILQLTHVAVSYQWYFNGQPIQDATMPFYSATASGVYYCEMIFATGCTAISSTVNVVLTSTSQDLLNNTMQLFPLPAKDALSFKCDCRINKVFVYDLQGAQVQSFNPKDYTIPNLGLNAGLYIVEIETSLGTITKLLPVLN